MSLKIKSFLPAALLLLSSVIITNGQAIESAGSSDSWLGRDKLAHFTVSLAAVGFANHWLEAENEELPVRARNLAMGFSLSLGLGKEIHDVTQPGNRFSFKDIAADVLGAVTGAILFTIK